MPAKSEKQQQMMAIALYHPEKLKKKNRNVLRMSKKALKEFASTSRNILAKRKKKED